jgi:hypothetical protein
MSWASRRRFSYLTGILVFFLVVVGGPIAYTILSVPATCIDGTQNQGETDIDKGGPCPLLDERLLSPSSILWARSFRVRDGVYNSVAYIQNSNKEAGTGRVGYRFGLYDSSNVLVAEKEGATFIMPGAVTPIFAGPIDTGNRVVTHTYFEFTEPVLWERMIDRKADILVTDKQVFTPESAPRVTARVENTSVSVLEDIHFVVAVFDTAGNTIASSETLLPRLEPRETKEIVFTWPTAFPSRPSRVDVIPLVAPTSALR